MIHFYFMLVALFQTPGHEDCALQAQQQMDAGIAAEQKLIFKQAETHFTEALIHYGHQENQQGISQAHERLGLIFEQQGRLEQAVRHYLDQARAASHLPVVQRVLLRMQAALNLGRVHVQQGKLDEAAGLLESGLTIANELQFYQHACLFKMEMAALEQARANYPGAVKHCEQGLALLQHMKRPEEGPIVGAFRLQFLDQMAFSFRLQGQKRKAIETTLRMIDAMPKGESNMDKGFHYGLVAHDYMVLEDYRSANGALGQLANIATALNAPFLSALEQRSRAILMSFLGQPTRVLAACGEALVSLNAAPTTITGTMLPIRVPLDRDQLKFEILCLQAGALAQLDDQPETVKKNLQQAQRIAQKKGAPNLQATALTLHILSAMQHNRIQEVITLLPALEALIPRLDLKHYGQTSLETRLEMDVLLAMAYGWLGELDRANDLLHDLETASGKVGQNSRFVQSGLVVCRALISVYRKDFLEAEERLKAALSHYETIRETLGDRDLWKIGFQDTYLANYSLIQRAMIEQDRVEEALLWADRAKAQVLDDHLGRLEKPGETMFDLAAIKQLARRQKATLIQYSLVFEPNPGLIARSIAGKQGAQATSLYIWVVSPKGDIDFQRVDLKKQRKATGNTLSRMVALARREAGGTDTSPGQGNATIFKQLYRFLIEPIELLLPPGTKHRPGNLVVIPHGMLNQVPFSALQNNRNAPLIERFTIRLAPSFKTLQALGPRTPSHVWNMSDALVAVDPHCPRIGKEREPPPPLPAANESGKNLCRQLGIGEPLRQGMATETAVKAKMRNAPLIHLESHGYAYDRFQLGYSGCILLKPGSGDDGYLVPSEVMGTDLNADLVFLGTCDSGGGLVTGEGILGFSSAFLYAGARSVLVANWKVKDSIFSQFVKTFYDHWLKGKNTAAAHRYAVLHIRNEHKEVWHWAPFTLIGHTARAPLLF